jgi:hypothetical protein
VKTVDAEEQNVLDPVQIVSGPTRFVSLRGPYVQTPLARIA